MPRTKIVATLGPASSDPQILRKMVEAGMDLARINLSHGHQGSHRARVETLRDAADAVGRPVPILMDLQGPKIRVGDLKAPMLLSMGQRVVLAPAGEAMEGEIPTTYSDLAQDLKPGNWILMDDGNLELICRSTRGNRAELEVIRGGILHPR
ncbi:MAG: pyruvate kinase, partial [Gemmatimonadota bacterium]